MPISDPFPCCMLWDSTTVNGGSTPEDSLTAMFPPTRIATRTARTITKLRVSFFTERTNVFSDNKVVMPLGQ